MAGVSRAATSVRAYCTASEGARLGHPQLARTRGVWDSRVREAFHQILEPWFAAPQACKMRLFVGV